MKLIGCRGSWWCSGRAGGQAGRCRRDPLRGGLLGRRLEADVFGVEAFFARHHRPQDAGVLVGHGHAGLLPSHARRQLRQPARGRVVASVGGHHRRLGALDQQRAQVVVAAFGDAPQTGLAAAGVLAWHQAQPGAELVAALELLEVTHAGGQRRRTEFADPDDFGRTLGRRAAAHMLADLLVAPAQVLVEFAPMIERALQHQPRRRTEFVAVILDHVGQHGA